MSASESDQKPEFAGRKHVIDQVSGVIWLILAAVAIYKSRELDYLDEFGPGAGFFPFWLGISLALLGIGLLVRVTFFNKEKREVITFASKKAGLQMILVMAAVFGFAFFNEKLGFFLSAGLLFLFLLFAVERKGWKFSLLIAVLASATLWAIFEVALQQQMPQGVLEIFY